MSGFVDRQTASPSETCRMVTSLVQTRSADLDLLLGLKRARPRSRSEGCELEVVGEGGAEVGGIGDGGADTVGVAGSDTAIKGG